MVDGSWTLAECPPDQVERLIEALGVSPTMASVLVRRGLTDPVDAKAFLEPEGVGHDPFLLGDMTEAVATLQAAIERGTPICVYGDYDVDGVCATAVAVTVLERLGAEVRWHVPSRFVEGYGLDTGTIETLAADGVGLLLAVDCGITAVEQIDRAVELGLEVIVCDHHRPDEQLPACPLVVTRPSSYPFPELCGAGVVYKLMQALAPSEALTGVVELVGMATIADVVPLLDENRALATAGLRRLARTERPGLRALMRVARVDPAAVDEGAVGFRLGPRINAAGRLGCAEVALRLVLTSDEAEAEELAAQLETMNRERQALEERILREALAEIDAWTPSQRARRAYVLWGEEWHQGVIGIVASRLVERFHRPVVMVAGADDAWRGSGRSIPAFDLHAALAACSDQLEQFGGHRAAAGVTVDPDRLDTFAAALAEHAASVLDDADLQPVQRVDAVVRGDELTLELCDELARLAPFGLGNPGVTLLASSCRVAELATVGDGKHLRMAVLAERGRSGAIAFGWGPELDRFRVEGAWDLAFRLQANRWNGTVTPQLIIKRAYETPPSYEELRRRLTEEWRAGPQAWSPIAREVFEELGFDEQAGATVIRRHLLDSSTFRSLLTAELPALAAAA